MYRTLVSSSKSSVLALLMMLVFVVFVFLHAVDVLPEHYATIKINDFEVDTVEVFVNVSSTLSVLVSCIVYRRRRVLKDTSLKLITCALLRTRLTLVPASRTASGTTSTHMQMKLRRESVLGSRKQSATQSARLRQHRAKLARAVLAAYRLKAPAISFSARSKLLEAASDHSSLHRQLLRIVPQALQNIDSRDTLVRHVTPSKDLSRLEKRALYLVGVIGMSLTVASFVPLDVSGTKQIVLQVGAFVTSVAFVVVFVALGYALLRGHGIHDVVRVDSLVDALTPRIRRHLGFKKLYAGFALVALSVCMLRVVASLMLDTTNGYHNSLIARVPLGGGVVLQFRTKSAFLNRMFPLSMWTLRMLWELVVRREEELVFISGAVEYFCPLEMLPAIHSSQVNPQDDVIGPSQGTILSKRVR